jgi:hypothetical protein
VTKNMRRRDRVVERLAHAAEGAGEPALTVRELVAQFAGLSGSAKQKAATDAAGLSGARLADPFAGAAAEGAAGAGLPPLFVRCVLLPYRAINGR